MSALGASTDNTANTGSARGDARGRADDGDALISLPMLGTHTMAQHRYRLLGQLVVWLLVLALVVFWIWGQGERVHNQQKVTQQALQQISQLETLSTQAMAGKSEAFATSTDAAAQLVMYVRALQSGDAELGVSALGDAFRPDLIASAAVAESLMLPVSRINTQKKTLEGIAGSLLRMNGDAAAALALTQAMVDDRGIQGWGATEVHAADQLLGWMIRVQRNIQMLRQPPAPELTPIARTGEAPAKPPSRLSAITPLMLITQLDQDLITYRAWAKGLLEGSSELRLVASKDAALRDNLIQLMLSVDSIRTELKGVVGPEPLMAPIRAQHTLIYTAGDQLRLHLQLVEKKLGAFSGPNAGQWAALAVSAIFALFCLLGLQRLRSLHQQAQAANRWQDYVKKPDAGRQTAFQPKLVAAADSDVGSDVTDVTPITSIPSPGWSDRRSPANVVPVMMERRRSQTLLPMNSGPAAVGEAQIISAADFAIAAGDAAPTGKIAGHAFYAPVKGKTSQGLEDLAWPGNGGTPGAVTVAIGEPAKAAEGANAPATVPSEASAPWQGLGFEIDLPASVQQNAPTPAPAVLEKAAQLAAEKEASEAVAEMARQLVVPPQLPSTAAPAPVVSAAPAEPASPAAVALAVPAEDAAVAPLAPVEQKLLWVTDALAQQLAEIKHRDLSQASALSKNSEQLDLLTLQMEQLFQQLAAQTSLTQAAVDAATQEKNTTHHSAESTEDRPVQNPPAATAALVTEASNDRAAASAGSDTGQVDAQKIEKLEQLLASIQASLNNPPAA